jgi:hypothetical protein
VSEAGENDTVIEMREAEPVGEAGVAGDEVSEQGADTTESMTPESSSQLDQKPSGTCYFPCLRFFLFASRGIAPCPRAKFR